MPSGRSVSSHCATCCCRISAQIAHTVCLLVCLSICTDLIDCIKSFWSQIFASAKPRNEAILQKFNQELPVDQQAARWRVLEKHGQNMQLNRDFRVRDALKRIVLSKQATMMLICCCLAAVVAAVLWPTEIQLRALDAWMRREQTKLHLTQAGWICHSSSDQDTVLRAGANLTQIEEAVATAHASHASPQLTPSIAHCTVKLRAPTASAQMPCLVRSVGSDSIVDDTDCLSVEDAAAMLVYGMEQTQQCDVLLQWLRHVYMQSGAQLVDAVAALMLPHDGRTLADPSAQWDCTRAQVNGRGLELNMTGSLFTTPAQRWQLRSKDGNSWVHDLLLCFAIDPTLRSLVMHMRITRMASLAPVDLALDLRDQIVRLARAAEPQEYHQDYDIGNVLATELIPLMEECESHSVECERYTRILRSDRLSTEIVSGQGELCVPVNSGWAVVVMVHGATLATWPDHDGRCGSPLPSSLTLHRPYRVMVVEHKLQNPLYFRLDIEGQISALTRINGLLLYVLCSWASVAPFDFLTRMWKGDYRPDGVLQSVLRGVGALAPDVPAPAQDETLFMLQLAGALSTGLVQRSLLAQGKRVPWVAYVDLNMLSLRGERMRDDLRVHSSIDVKWCSLERREWLVASSTSDSVLNGDGINAGFTAHQFARPAHTPSLRNQLDRHRLSFDQLLRLVSITAFGGSMPLNFDDPGVAVHAWWEFSRYLTDADPSGIGGISFMQRVATVLTWLLAVCTILPCAVTAYVGLRHLGDPWARLPPIPLPAVVQAPLYISVVVTLLHLTSYPATVDVNTKAGTVWYILRTCFTPLLLSPVVLCGITFVGLNRIPEWIMLAIIVIGEPFAHLDSMHIVVRISVFIVVLSLALLLIIKLALKTVKFMIATLLKAVTRGVAHWSVLEMALLERVIVIHMSRSGTDPSIWAAWFLILSLGRLLIILLMPCRCVHALWFRRFNKWQEFQRGLTAVLATIIVTFGWLLAVPQHQDLLSRPCTLARYLWVDYPLLSAGPLRWLATSWAVHLWVVTVILQTCFRSPSPTIHGPVQPQHAKVLIGVALYMCVYMLLRRLIRYCIRPVALPAGQPTLPA